MSSAKFVRLSKSNLYRNTKSIIKYLKLNKKDVAITNMPFFYSYMLSIINTHLHVGGSIVISKDSIIQKNSGMFTQKIKLLRSMEYHMFMNFFLKLVLIKF